MSSSGKALNVEALNVMDNSRLAYFNAQRLIVSSKCIKIV